MNRKIRLLPKVLGIEARPTPEETKRLLRAIERAQRAWTGIECDG